MVKLRDRYGLGALALYSALSLLFFGRGLLGHFSDYCIGTGFDPANVIWILAWWPYAIGHRLNPLITHVIWAPDGLDLAWMNCSPLASVLISPITLAYGPVAAYNTLFLLCPPLDAWVAFILCRYVAKSYWPSIVGGFVFGFSAYMLGHLLGHLNLIFVFLIPLIVWLVLIWLDNGVTPRMFTTLLLLLLVGQFLSSLEVFATMSLFGIFALLVVWGTGPPELRAGLRSIVPLIVCAYAITIVAVSPYLYYFFAFGRISLPPGALASAEPLNLVIPPPTNLFGGWKVAKVLCAGPNIYETGSYIGLPMLLLVWNFARLRREQPQARILVRLCLIAFVASFGPWLMLKGQKLLPLPWMLFSHLPLIHHALPARLTVYAYLALGIVVSLWLSNKSISVGARILAAAVTVFFLLPNLKSSAWSIPTDTPTFFSSGIYRRYLSRGDNVLILPYGIQGDSDTWQAITSMYFRMAGGYVGISPAVPAGFQLFSIVYDFYNLGALPYVDEQVKTFLVQKNVNAIIIADEGKHFWVPHLNKELQTFQRVGLSANDRQVVRSFFSGLGIAPIEVGGVSFYRVPLDRLSLYESLNPREVELRAALVRVNALIVAAQDYLSQDLSLKKLNPLAVQRLGLLPPLWVSGPLLDASRDLPLQNGLVLGRWKGRVAVGLLGSRDTIQEIARRYQGTAHDIHVLPANYRTFSAAESCEWALFMSFDRAELARAAQSAHVSAMQAKTALSSSDP